MSPKTFLISALAAASCAFASPTALPPRQDSLSTSPTFTLRATVTSAFDLTPSLNGMELYGNDTRNPGSPFSSGFGYIIFAPAGSGSGFYTNGAETGIAWFAITTATSQAPLTVANGEVVTAQVGSTTGTSGVTVSGSQLVNEAGGAWMGCPASFFGFSGDWADDVVLSWRAENETTREGCAEVVLTPVCDTVLAAPSGAVNVTCVASE
jgi:hypothetical protein